MKILRTGRPVQTRRADADLSAKSEDEATVEACRVDFVVGAEERKAFDARARSEQQGATT